MHDFVKDGMRGHLVRKVWRYDPTLYAPPRYRRACEYEAFVPEPLADLSVSLPGDVSAVVSDAERAIAKLNSKEEPALRPLARLLLRTESIASSKVEGMQVDARALARAEVANETGRRVESDAAEVLANIDAMQLAVEHASATRNVAPADLAAIHRALLERITGHATVGHFRNKQNWIGGNDYNPCGADYVPPPHEQVAAALDDLCKFCDEDTLPPLVQCAIAHAQFETIHPFEDGNGRVGRALVQVILRRRGLAPTFVPPISVVLARNKSRYIRGLVLFREDRLDEWLSIFASAAAQAAMLADRYAGRVAELQDRWRNQLRKTNSPRADSAAWAIIDVLPAYPFVTVAVAATAANRTKPAINHAIEVLAKAGVLKPLSSSKRNRTWEAVGLVDLIAEFENGR
jgi:Fic family protein